MMYGLIKSKHITIQKAPGEGIVAIGLFEKNIHEKAVDTLESILSGNRHLII